MFPYLALASVSSYFAIVGRARERSLLLLFLMCLWVALLIGLRSNVGMDWNNYVIVWYKSLESPLLDMLASAEPGWGLLLYLARETGIGLTGVNLIAGLVFGFGLFQLLKECDEPLLALCAALPILVIATAMSALRQSLALGIEFIVIAHWRSWPVAMRAGGLLLAASFHFSAIFLLAFLAADPRLLRSNLKWLALPVGAIGLFVATRSARFENYTQDYSQADSVQSSGVYLHLALLLVPFAIYAWRRKVWGERFGSLLLLDAMGLAFVACLAIAPISSVSAGRFSLYLWPAAIIIYAALPKLFDTPRAQVGIRVIIVAVAALMTVIWLTYSNSRNAYVPYQSIWISNDARTRGTGVLP